MLILDMNKRLRKSQGQVVLMVLLASTLVLVLGLSAAKQATVETSIDTDQELLKRAFNAAESGIEYYKKTGEKNYGDSDTQGKSTLTTESLGGNDKSLSLDKKINPDEVAVFWLVNHEENGDIGSDYYGDNTVKICSDDQPGVINFKVDYFYKEGVNYKVQRFFDSNSSVPTTGLTSPNNCAEVRLAGNPVLIAVTPMGVASKISVKGSRNFPVQGEKISAIGSVDKINNLVTIDHPYKLVVPFLFETVVSEKTVTNQN